MENLEKWLNVLGLFSHLLLDMLFVGIDGDYLNHSSTQTISRNGDRMASDSEEFSMYATRCTKFVQAMNKINNEIHVA